MESCQEKILNCHKLVMRWIWRNYGLGVGELWACRADCKSWVFWKNSFHLIEVFMKQFSNSLRSAPKHTRLYHTTAKSITTITRFPSSSSSQLPSRFLISHAGTPQFSVSGLQNSSQKKRSRRWNNRKRRLSKVLVEAQID
mgnify:CR=1 FL=1